MTAPPNAPPNALADPPAGLAAPLGRKTASELVVTRVLDLMRAGHLRPGDRLPPERELARTLAVSRPTLREALRALSILGVLEIRHGGGAVVAAPDPAELLQPLDLFVTLGAGDMAAVFEARIAFEPLVAARAAERLTEAQLDRLHALVASQAAHPDDAELFHDTDIELHKTILDAAGNPYLTRFGRLLQVLGDQGRKAYQKRKHLRQRSIEDHQALMAALGGRDAAAAQRSMRQHMINVLSAIREATGA
jgi:GntR family transcriptional repressor for pyruvate dehydrogenase complex